ncbi:MAG: hypothetical protein U0174_08415 [Polyangiaceae bacterium]
MAIGNPHRYVVTVRSEEGGPEPQLLERFSTIAAFRLGRLDAREGHYPKVGGFFDMLDNLSGPYLWERSDEQMANEPPTRIDFEVLEVDPPEPPATPSDIRVLVRVPF